MSSNDTRSNSSLEDERTSDPSRDFLPPPSHVRTDRRRPNHPEIDNDSTPLQHNLRVSPVLGRGSRARDEALARQAVRDQLQLPARTSRASRPLPSRNSTAASIQRPEQRHQSRSTSSLHGIGDETTGANELYSVPMGSFTEDSPPRPERRPSSPVPQRRPNAPAPHSAPPSVVYYPPAVGYYPGGYYLPPAALPSRRGTPRLLPPHALGYPPYYAYPPPPPQRVQHPPVVAVAPAAAPAPVPAPVPVPLPAPTAFEAEPTDNGWDFDDPFPSTASSESNDRNLAETPTKSNRSIFRSPPSAGQDLSASPIFRGSPNLSFGIDTTPGGVATEDFSPMGPSFAGMAPGRLNLSGDDEDDDEPLSVLQNPASLIGLMDFFDPEDGGLMDVRRSPLQSSSERRARSKLENPPPPFRKGGPAQTHKSQPLADPYRQRSQQVPIPHAASAVKPRNIWLDHSNATGGMKRVTMGGAQGSLTMSLEGINNMLRDQSTPRHESQPPQFRATTTSRPIETMRLATQPPVPRSGELKLPPKSDRRTQQSKKPAPVVSQLQNQEQTPQLAPKQAPFLAHSQSHQMPFPPVSYVQQPTKGSTDFNQQVSSSLSVPSMSFGNPAAQFPSDQAHQPNGSFLQGNTPQVPVSFLPPRNSPSVPPPQSFPVVARTPQVVQPQVKRPASEPAKSYYGHRKSPAIVNAGQAHSASKVSGRAVRPPEHGGDSNQTARIKSPFATAGKENLDSTRSPLSASKRAPCHCKKSKCLKLYCECFSMKMFCDGCKCIDCYNTERHVAIRDKAIAETITKNKTAFESRSTGTLIACKCKRSECLKKYCECFSSGEVCHAKCKCLGCANHAGSQKLIDKRRKMKDIKGAEYAMKISKEAWEASTQSMPTIPAKPPRLEARTSTPSQSFQPPMFRAPVLLQPPPPSRRYATVSEPRLMRTAGFSPMDRTEHPYVTPSLTATAATRVVKSKQTPGSRKAPPKHVAPSVKGVSNHSAIAKVPHETPKAPATTPIKMEDSDSKQETPYAPVATASTSTSRRGVRRLFSDPSAPYSLRKKPKLDMAPDASGHVLALYFGSKLPPQSRLSVLTILSFLSNSELYQASLVCKDWSELAVDDDLWKRKS